MTWRASLKQGARTRSEGSSRTSVCIANGGKGASSGEVSVLPSTYNIWGKGGEGERGAHLAWGKSQYFPAELGEAGLEGLHRCSMGVCDTSCDTSCEFAGVAAHINLKNMEYYFQITREQLSLLVTQYFTPEQNI